MMVEIACLYTSCEWPSRRNSTQKLSNDVTTPVSLTPLIKKIVRGFLLLRTVFRNKSCKFCERSAIVFFYHPLHLRAAAQIYSCIIKRSGCPSATLQSPPRTCCIVVNRHYSF